MDKETKNRINRLAGDGEDERAGGGLPLPTMLQTTLEYIVDHEAATLPQIGNVIERTTLNRQSRIERIYHKHYAMKGEPFQLCAQDILDQMSAVGVVHVNGNQLYSPGPEFKLRERLQIIPRRKGIDACFVTVLPPDERNIVSDAALHTLEISALASELKPDGRGLRPIDKDNVARLAESMRAFGFMEYHPVLVDQHGRILSGRHRIKAAEVAGIEYRTREINVVSDLEALAIAFTANEGSGFSKREREAIAKRLSAAGVDVDHIGRVIGNIGKRTLIQAELFTDPTRSDRRIAEEIGVHNETVGAVRRELESGDGSVT